MSKTPGKKKRNWLNIITIFLSVVILALFVSSSDFPHLIDLLWGARSRWYFFVAAVGCMLVYFLAEAVSIYVLIRRFYPKVSFGTIFRTTMIGQFFNCTTPFATGGQPMQIFAMTKKGIGVGVGTSALLARYVMSQTVVALFGLVFMFFYYSYYASAIPAFGLWLGIGIAICLVLVLLVVVLLCFPVFAKKTVAFLIRLLGKLRLVRRVEMRLDQAEQEINTCCESFSLLKSHKDCLLVTLGFTILQTIAQISITWFIYLGFGAPGGNGYGEITSAQLFVQLISSYFPTPGATGASELSYYAIFNHALGSMEYVTSAMLIWRVITFYFPIAFGSFFTMGLQKQKEKAESGETA